MEQNFNTKETTLNITSKEVREAIEQVRAGFTISRLTLAACTLLYPLKRKGKRWADKFMKIQNEYHSFLLETYNEFEEELHKLEEKESSEEAYNEIQKVK